MIEPKPFIPYRYTEERQKDTSKVFTVRLNQQEQAMIKDIMALLNINSPGTALKVGATIGFNVLQNTFSKDILKWLTSKDRTKLEDYHNLDKPQDLNLKNL